jgi:hypothetical protein
VRWTLILLLLLAPGAAAEDSSPFAGWSEDQVRKHRRAAGSEIAKKLRDWMKAREGFIYQCGTCRGYGYVKRVIRRGRSAYVQKVPCTPCGQKGAKVDEEDLRAAVFSVRSPAWRGRDGAEEAYQALLGEARADPVGVSKRLRLIDKYDRKGIEIFGNFAETECRVRYPDEKTAEKLTWIEVDGSWWLSDETADADFRRWKYEETADDPEKPEAPAGEGPDPRPRPGGVKPPPVREPKPEETPPRPEPKPRPPLEDPAKLFTVDAPTIRKSTEGAFKVFGRVTNKTSDRRFAYVIVTVSVFRGTTLVDTAECNVGTAILKPGESATYSGWLYVEELPEHDRVETKVTKYEQLE